MNKEKLDISNIATQTDDLKNKIAVLLAKGESVDLNELESQVSILLINMVNFFSNYIDEIKSYDELLPNQQKYLLSQLKDMTCSIKNKKIKSIDEMLNNFVFIALSSQEIELEDEENELDLLSKAGFKALLRKIINFDIYKQSNQDMKQAKIKRVLNKIRKLMSASELTKSQKNETYKLDIKKPKEREMGNK
ncbi:MAG: hypothetical protein AABY27_05760 [Pseudomonadota bacterium]